MSATTPLPLGPCTTLVERDRELAELTSMAELAASKGCCLVLLTGEAGVGKTRLWTEFVDTLPDGWRFAYAGGQRTDRSLSAPFAGLVGHVDPEGDPERALADALGHALSQLQGNSPLLFVVEDLHLLDPVAVGTLDHLLEALAEWPVLVVGTFRLGSHPLGSPHSRAVAGLLRHPAAAEIRVTPLSAAGVETMVQALGGDVADLIGGDFHTRTGGNPFFVEELVRAPLGTLPWTVREVVDSRLRDMPPRHQRAAELLAVAGGRLLKPVADVLDGADGFSALVGALLAVDDGDAVRLRHALVAEAVLAQLDDGVRRVRHREIALALEQSSGAPPENLAHHWAGAGEPARAAPAAALAADHLNAARSHHTAVELYRIALQHPPDNHAQRAALLERAAMSAAQAGFTDLARSWGMAVRVAEDAGGPQWEASGAFGNPVFQRMVRQAIGGDEEVVTALSARVVEAQRLVRTSQFDDALKAARAILGSAIDVGDRALEADTAVILFYAGDVDGGAAELERITEESIAAGDLVAATNALARRSRVSWALGDLNGALRFSQDGLTIARRAGGPDFFASLQMGTAFYRTLRGELREAQALTDEMMTVADQPNVLNFATVPLIQLALLRGEVAEARQLVDSLVPVVRALQVDYYSLPVLLLACRAELLAGKLETAAQLFAEVEALLWSPVQEHMVDVVITAVDLGLALEDRGRLDTAQMQASDLARTIDGHAQRAAADLAAGSLRLQQDKPEEAALFFARAATAFEAVPRWPDVVAVRCQLARCLADVGRAADAIAEIDRAEMVAAQLGLRQGRRRAATLRTELLSAAGDRTAVESSAADPAGDLSERERHMLRLVVEGRSNREIGAALYLSEKTVRNTLTRTFAKIGVSRRGEVAAWFRSASSGGST